MTDSAFKKRRPGALRIPNDEEDDYVTASQLVDMIANMECGADYEGAPLSAPGGMTHQQMDAGLRDMIFSGERAVDVDVRNRGFLSQRPVVQHQSVSWSPVTNPFVTPRERTCVKVENQERSSQQQSLPDSPSEAGKSCTPSAEGITSGITSPTESPRPGSDSYRKKAAAKRQRRRLYRAMKAKRPSSALAMSGNNMDALSSMKEMVVEETLDKKTALAVKNRENAFKARQTTKEKIQKLNDQNTNLQKEVADLQQENKTLKAKNEQLVQQLTQLLHPGYSRFS